MIDYTTMGGPTLLTACRATDHDGLQLPEWTPRRGGYGFTVHVEGVRVV